MKTVTVKQAIENKIASFDIPVGTLYEVTVTATFPHSKDESLVWCDCYDGVTRAVKLDSACRVASNEKIK